MKALTAEVLGDLADCDECSGVTKAVARKRISKYATVQYRKCPECGATKVINTLEIENETRVYFT